MRAALWVLGVSVVLVGCGPSEEEAEFAFGEAEMEALVVGKWSGAWLDTPDSTARFTLDVRRPPPPDSRTSCTSRAFSARSGMEGPGQRVACGPNTDMHLEATLEVDDASLEPASLAGSVNVSGDTLRGAGLELVDEKIELGATYGYGVRSWHDCQARMRETNAVFAECTLEERAP
jgi:hypothetical protein